MANSYLASLGSYLIQQIPQTDAERLRQPINDPDRWIAGTAFKIADIRPVEIGVMGEVFLRPPRSMAQPLQVFT